MEIIDIKDSIVSEQIKTSIDEMVNAYCDELINKDKEIERLNNIINELEKELEIIDNIDDSNIIKMQVKNMIFKLKELKEEK